MRLDVTISIVNTDNRRLLKDCLSSLPAGSEGLETEVFVVDNASTDGSAEMVAREFPGVQVMRNAIRGGFTANHNQVLRHAPGRYALILNEDTVVRPGAIDVLVRFMDGRPDAGACGPQLLNPDGSLQPSGEPFPTCTSALLSELTRYRWDRRKYFWRGRDFGAVTRVPAVSGACLMVRRETLDAVGLLDEGFFFYYDDLDLCRRIARAGWHVYYVPQARVMHYWGATRAGHLPMVLREGRRSQLYFFAKHYGPQRLVLLKLILGLSDLGELVRWAVAYTLGARDRRAARERLALRWEILRMTLGYPGAGGSGPR
ncbi:MAG: glycosyltransferase family 2 protein [Chloroflexi bacterium]|nr:glycosyltransferase family 2 protein [Chloroflexota bacterium]